MALRRSLENEHQHQQVTGEPPRKPVRTTEYFQVIKIPRIVVILLSYVKDSEWGHVHVDQGQTLLGFACGFRNNSTQNYPPVTVSGEMEDRMHPDVPWSHQEWFLVDR